MKKHFEVGLRDGRTTIIIARSDYHRMMGSGGDLINATVMVKFEPGDRWQVRPLRKLNMNAVAYVFDKELQEVAQ